MTAELKRLLHRVADLTLSLAFVIVVVIVLYNAILTMVHLIH